PPATLGPASPPSLFPGAMSLPPTRFNFKIDPNTPVEKLLPTAPKGKKPAGPMLSDDLGKVPEEAFEEQLATDVASQEASKHTAHTIAKLNHVNGKQTDSYMQALLGARSDLAGLPVAMGDYCRTKGEQSKQFARAVATVRTALAQGGSSVPMSTA